MIRKLFIHILVAFCACTSLYSQSALKDINGLELDTIRHFTSEHINPLRLILHNQYGWIYKEGHDPDWALDSIDYSGWRRVIPGELDTSYADEEGRIEGWFRFRFSVNDTIARIPLYLQKAQHFAAEVYLDGALLEKYGETGVDVSSFREYVSDNPFYQLPVSLQSNKIYTLAVHYVDYTVDNHRHTKQELARLFPFINFVTNAYFDDIRNTKSQFDILLRSTILFMVMFFSLYIVYRRKVVLLCLLYTILGLTTTVIWKYAALDFDFTYLSFDYLRIARGAFFFINSALFAPITAFMLSLMIIEQTKKEFILLIILSAIVSVALFFYDYFTISYLMIGAYSLSCSLLMWTIWKHRSSIYGAKLFVIWGYIIYLILQGVVIISLILGLVNSYAGFVEMISLNSFVIIISFALFIAKELKDSNLQIAEVESEKRKILADQYATLERQVEERTNHLNQSLKDLKATQTQLIQSEKMASLGELTAGIAHEIQNPLNFVNNFSDVSGELLDEVKEEIENDNKADALEIIGDLKGNLEKISHHGGRASSIVRGMLDHSRASSGEKTPTDINALCDEYLRLSYHGLRAKDKSFNASFETDFDESLPKINMVSQDMGRVLLNIVNNAFFACAERGRRTVTSAPLSDHQNFKPKVTISTRRLSVAEASGIEIRIQDNGIGMSQETIDKVFQPFFTTKPTGQGTGLGMSISYDIVTKGHGGELKVESEEGEGSEFIIHLPIV